MRNQADGLIHSTEKSLKDVGDKVSADEKSRIEAAMADLKEAMKKDDKELIEAKTKELTDASGKIAEHLYAQQQQQQTATPGEATGESTEKPAGDNVVDAEFEEVKEDKDKK